MVRRLKALARWLLPPSLLGWLRMQRLWGNVRRYAPRTVRHMYGGHEFQIRLTDGFAAGWYDHDWPVLAEIEFLRGHRLRPGATVFDLGAHHGVVALMLAAEVTPSGRVVAVEANPHNAAAAEANARLNRADHLTVRYAAVSDCQGTLTFNEGLNGQVDDGTGAWGRVDVPAVTVDQLSVEFGPPAVLFIDVEGYECHALRGAAQTLARYRPDCFVEVHLGAGLEKFGSVEELLGFFPTDAYDVYHLPAEETGELPLPTTPAEIRVLAKRFFLIAVSRA